MKKFDIKSAILGFIIGTIGITTAFASTGIESAIISNAKVTYNGHNVKLNNSLVAIVKENEKDASLYMPIRELLEYLGYDVNWDNKESTVVISSDNKKSSNDITSTTEPIILNKEQYTYLTELKIGQIKSERVMLKIDSPSAFLYLEIEDYSEPIGIKVYYGDTNKLVFGSLGSTFVEGSISGFPVDRGAGIYSVELIRSEKSKNCRVALYGVATEKITDYENIDLPNTDFISK